MYLSQKFGYDHGLVTSIEQMLALKEKFQKENPRYMVFDTETDSLDIIKGVPFILSFGWGKTVYVFDLETEMAPALLSILYEMADSEHTTDIGETYKIPVFAHNCKYDYHMTINYGTPVPPSVRLCDSQTVARLTNYSDEDLHKSLEEMGTKYVDPTAKFGSKVIKAQIAEIRKVRKAATQALFKKTYPKVTFGKVWEAYGDRVQFLHHEYDDYFAFFDYHYKDPNFKDVYKQNPNLMLMYAIDDCVIMIEWLNQALPALNSVDPGLKVFQRECKLIRTVAKMERVGFYANVKYLLESRERVVNYQKTLYDELYALAGRKDFSVYATAKISKIFSDKFKITLDGTDSKQLKRVVGSKEAKRFASVIRLLRTVDKWLGTYIDGYLNRVIDGRIYGFIDNSGAVSGRVSSNLQQLPKEALFDEDGNELFHPRKFFMVDNGYKMYFLDYSQQELRVQAYYTILISGGDKLLCRAYMPFRCVSMLTDELFDPKDKECLSRWNSGEWVLEEDPTVFWTKTDVHNETTLKAFPFLNNDPTHPQFDHYRKLGKVCNFLKNYQGGKGAIIDQLDVDDDIAEALDKAYYAAFPDIKKYQSWCTNQMYKYGFVENLYGRRYYMRSSKWFYKVSNYLVQGSCADMVKVCELRISELLEGTKSDLIMAVHDELILRMHTDDEHLIPQIKAIMEDIPEVPYVPMIADVDVSTSDWATKTEVEI